MPAASRELRRCVRARQCLPFKGQNYGRGLVAVRAGRRRTHGALAPSALGPRWTTPSDARSRRAHAELAAGAQVPGQQLSTDYARWWASEGHALPYRVPCFDKTSFEPYLVVRASSSAAAASGSMSGGGPVTGTEERALPSFDERYVGYGKNKVQWVEALRSAGYSFWVLPRAFVVHWPHESTQHNREQRLRVARARPPAPSAPLVRQLLHRARAVLHRRVAARHLGAQAADGRALRLAAAGGAAAGGGHRRGGVRPAL